MNFNKFVLNLQRSGKYLLYKSNNPDMEKYLFPLIKTLDISKYSREYKYLLIFKR